MKFRNPFRALRGANRYDIAAAFNKAAMVAVPTAVGYQIGGVFGAVFAAVNFKLGFDLGVLIPASMLGMEPHILARHDENTYIGREFMKLKEAVGVEEDVELVVVRTSGTLVVAASRPPRILIPCDLEETMSEDELLSLLKHELAHIKNKDIENQLQYGRGGLRAALANTFVGGVTAIFSGDARHIFLAGAGVLAHKAMTTFNRKNAEYRADAFAAKHDDPVLLFNSFSRMPGSPERIIKNGLYDYKLLTVGIPSMMSGLIMDFPSPPFLTNRPMFEYLRGRAAMVPHQIGQMLETTKIPELLFRGARKVLGMFSGSHPSDYSRKQKFKAAALDKNLDLQDDLEEPSVLDVCMACTGIREPMEKHNAALFIREAFYDAHGHRDVTVQFNERCNSGVLVFLQRNFVIISGGRPFNFPSDDGLHGPD